MDVEWLKMLLCHHICNRDQLSRRLRGPIGESVYLDIGLSDLFAMNVNVKKNIRKETDDVNRPVVYSNWTKPMCLLHFYLYFLKTFI